MVDDTKQFQQERSHFIKQLGQDPTFKSLSIEFMRSSVPHKYSYNFDWLGLPIIQYPQDIVAIQEVIWKVKPDIIIETGVARGGSLILSASILHLLNGNGKVIGIDIDIRPHNRKAIEEHPLSPRIELIEGSSITDETLQSVKSKMNPSDRVMVILDSNHTHEHVLKELELYSPLVKSGSYLIVMDTVIEDVPECTVPNRSWSKGNNPKTAIHEFMKHNNRFEIDQDIHNKLSITVAQDGYLKCIQ